jgi:FemAB-related protein (PEP-CTERM system-associated)
MAAAEQASKPATIRRYGLNDAARWDDYVRRAPGASLSHLAGWQRVIQQTWGYRPYSMYAERGERLVGVLPLFHVRSRLFGSMLVSTPAAIYGGVLADDPEARLALIAEATQLATDLQVDYLELRNAWEHQVISDSTFWRKHLYVTFDRLIEADEAALLQSYPKKIRYSIRQGLKNGLVSAFGRFELLDDFYEVFATNMRNLGTPVYPKRLFNELLMQFPDACDIMLIRQGRRTAGASINVYFRDAVLPHYACAHSDMHHTGVSAFMYWELMREAAARGATRFDFGRSKRGSGSWAFKRGWRMAERPLPYCYFGVRATSMPELNPTNPRFRLLIKAWQQLPVGLTKLIGPIVVKNIP